MEFRHSCELLSKADLTGGLAGSIPLRRSRFGEREDIGARRARQDWARHVGPIDGFYGGSTDSFGPVQVAVPECQPDRLEWIAYAAELGFLYDDWTELCDQDELNSANDKMQSSFIEGAHQAHNAEAKQAGLTALQDRLIKGMMAIDEDRAKVAARMWAEFLQHAAGREHNAVHESFKAYMRYRVLDIGQMYWMGLVTFGMALTIPEPEIARVKVLTRPCFFVLALQNDLCSYAKEEAVAEQKSAQHIVNALWYLMRDHDTDLKGAKELCRTQIALKIEEYQRVVEEHKYDEKLSKDARIYIEALSYTISGNAAWSLMCPRYNSGQMLNALHSSTSTSGLRL